MARCSIRPKAEAQRMQPDAVGLHCVQRQPTSKYPMACHEGALLVGFLFYEASGKMARIRVAAIVAMAGGRQEIDYKGVAWTFCRFL